MYPSLYFFFKDFLGLEINSLQIINTFGFFVALALIAAHMVMSRELRRKEKEGLLKGYSKTVKTGVPLKPAEYVISGVLGFVLGYKTLGLFLDFNQASDDMQAYMFSARGNLLGGLAVAAIFVYFRYRENEKIKQQEPGEREVWVRPHQLMGDITILAALAGFLGAKIFHNLENLSEFEEDPWEALISFGGFTFFGGLICGAIAVLWYAGKKGINWKHMLDVGAPAMMLAYGIGRLGCQLSGDGDWGVLNSAYVSMGNGKVTEAQAGDYESVLTRNAAYYLRDTSITSLSEVRHIPYKAPSFLPAWTVAQAYPRNVIKDGVKLDHPDDARFDKYLPVPVFPTPLYESVLGILLFIPLWVLRKKIKAPGKLFALYMIIAGIERFFIEKIRVNTTIDYLPFQPTQAEVISLFLIITGLAGMLLLKKKQDGATA